MKQTVDKPPKISLCRQCHGTGITADTQCPQCHGTGRVTVSAHIQYDIRPYHPPHTPDHQPPSPDPYEDCYP